MMVVAVMLVICFTTVSAAYKNEIYVSNKLELSNCVKVHRTFYQCGSLSQAFQLLETCCDSTDIVIEPGKYSVNASFTVHDLTNIRIRSYSQSERTVIHCPSNVNSSHDFDTGLAFIKVTDLILENLNILGCGMKHVSTIQFGSDAEEKQFITLRSALFIQNSSNINLFNTVISESNGIGLLLFDTVGTVNITSSLFTENKLNSLEETKYFTGGGGIYIEFTNCTPGVAACDPSSNVHNSLSNYIIANCGFSGNNAIYNFSDSEPDRLASNVHVSFGAGGGLSVQFHGYAQNNTFRIISCIFALNKANSGGGVSVDAKEKSSNNYVEILQSSFYGNLAYMYQGGGGAHMGVAIYQNNQQCYNNSFIIADCGFDRNSATKGVGGGITWYASHEPGQAQPTNYFEVCNSSFVNNEALYGSAVQINKEYHASVIGGGMLTLVIDSCNFTNNNLRLVNSSTFSSVGAVSASGVSIEFTGAVRFTKNNSTALVIDDAVAKFSDNSFAQFTENKGLHGGAILLLSDSWIEVHPNSSLLFVRNTAITNGGAIYVELSTPYDYILSHSCFVRYYSDNIFPDKWNTTFTFINNTVGTSYNAIFASTLRPCLNFYVEKTCEHIFLYDPPFYYQPFLPNCIATSPLLFTFDSTNASTLYVVPGEVYDLRVHLVDELCQNISGVMFIASCADAISPYVLPLYSFTNGSIQIAGQPHETCQLQLKTDSDYQITKVLQVILLNCPPGFEYNGVNKQCECITQPNPVISSCNLTSFQAHFDRYYWVGYVPDSNSSKIMLFGLCPYGYCYADNTSYNNQLLPKNATILDEFVCGKKNRTGILCGQCVMDYSVAVNSPMFTSHKCNKNRLGILYLLLYYIIPVTVLFYVIMAFNVKLTSGPVSAFLFFSQIISSQYFVYSNSIDITSPTAQSIVDVLLTIYSMSNLNFFHHEKFSYCLFASAGTVDILAFNMLLSLYPILLIFIYFLLRRYQWMIYKCKLTCYRISSRSVTHGICAFPLLYFARLNATSFAILKSADVSYLNNTTVNYRTVFYMQGTIPYFGNYPLYDVYMAGSIFLIVILIAIPTIILMLYPFISNIVIIFQWEESGGIQFVNKCLLVHVLKPILDSFQGDYKDHLRFFAGLYFFLYKTLFFCIVMIGSTPDIKILLFLMIIYFFLLTLVHVLAMPYKKDVDNAAYSLVFMLILIILLMEYFLLSINKASYTMTLIWSKVLLLAFPLCCLMLNCVWKVANKIRSFHRRNITNYQLLPDFPDRLINDDDDENETNDDNGDD